MSYEFYEQPKTLLLDLFNLGVMGKKEKYKVIFSEPATILFVDGKKYISKAHNEKFDPEKGLLMCLAKSNGITHLQLKNMLKNATNQKDTKNKKKVCKNGKKNTGRRII